MLIYYNFLLEKIILPLGDWMLGTSLMSELNRLRREVALSAEKLQQLQRVRLYDVLQHATAHAPYYKTFEKYRDKSPNNGLCLRLFNSVLFKKI